MFDTNGIYKPVRLNVGICGQGDCHNMNGLTSDLIMQNICVICRENPLNLEEIARTLGISTFYLDEKIEKMLYMDYIKQVGANKYQTAFFIGDAEYELANLRFSYENTLRIALPLLNITKEILPKLRISGLVEGEFSDEFFMYSIIIQLINNYLEDISRTADEKMGLSWSYPRRKDGSRYFVAADFRWKRKLDDYVSDDDFRTFCLESGGNGISTVSTGTAQSLQYFMKVFGGWRNFESEDLSKLMRIYTIIKSKEMPNDYDKEIISNLCEKGYVRVDNGMPVILVPMIRCGKKLDELRGYMESEFSELTATLDAQKEGIVDLVIKHRKVIDKLLPKYINKNEHDFLLSSNSGFSHYAVIYLLMKNGYLYTPNEDEKKRICTLIYLK